MFVIDIGVHYFCNKLNRCGSVHDSHGDSVIIIFLFCNY